MNASSDQLILLLFFSLCLRALESLKTSPQDKLSVRNASAIALSSVLAPFLLSFLLIDLHFLSGEHLTHTQPTIPSFGAHREGKSCRFPHSNPTTLIPQVVSLSCLS